MLTEYAINFNYRQAMEKADALQVQADRLRRIAEGDLENLMGSINQNWQSDSSGQYIAKMNQVREKLLQDARDVQRVSDTIRDVAERNRRTELRNLEIARRRLFNH